MMPLTREFKETVLARVRNDRGFRHALLREGIDCLLSGDVDAGKSVLRDYIKATIGFGPLARAVSIPEKSLLRMFGPSGNPQAKKLFHIVACLQRREGIKLEVKPRKVA